jgi:hypothetical protein
LFSGKIGFGQASIQSRIGLIQETMAGAIFIGILNATAIC